MATLLGQKLELAVYGFIQEIKLSCDIPDVIKNVIIAFAKFCFEWKKSKYGDHGANYNINSRFIFDNDNPAQLTKTGNGYLFLALDDILSLNVCKKFEWEFQIAKLLTVRVYFLKYRIN